NVPLYCLPFTIGFITVVLLFEVIDELGIQAVTPSMQGGLTHCPAWTICSSVVQQALAGMLSLSGVAPRNFVQVGSPTGVAEVKSIPPSAPVIVPDKSKPLTSVHDVDVMPDANGMFGTQASGMPEGSFRLQVARFIPQTIPIQSLYTTDSPSIPTASYNVPAETTKSPLHNPPHEPIEADSV